MNETQDLLTQFEAYLDRFKPEFGSVYNCDIEEIISAAQNDPAFAYPLLHVDLPAVRLLDRDEGAFARYKGSGVVMVNVKGFTTRKQVWKAAMVLVQKVLNQFSEDSHEKEDLYDFKYSEVEIEAVQALWADDALGWEFKFSLVMPADGLS
ncbi:hypothetical protein [Siphonobacter sp. SORGH_AS_0500]|uniref:hypothetical protein n=1 Tax=Siphonobacter sp. SORGH_AS_0500 TaxID=1864824 RepID=UPI002864420A|nr:hypothetical protein [Siphonobacter sp. SORGH_AS_0500]MDR6195636.1 hypothetical protein [Siphonobacter sp. SORGH_AS_0500]